MTELERLQAENEYLRAENAVQRQFEASKPMENAIRMWQSLPFQAAVKNCIYRPF